MRRYRRVAGARSRSSGREARLTSIFEETSAAVYGFLLVRCGDEAVASDVMSEVYVAAARAVSGENPDQVTKTWLLTVARRRLIDHWRRSATRCRTLTSLVNEERPSTGDPLASPEQVLAALGTLKPNYRMALTLRYIDDLSVTEVASSLDVSYQAAESLLARARRAFKESWSDL